MIALLIVKALVLPCYLGRQAQRLLGCYAHVISQCQTCIECAHIGPGNHIHGCGTAGIHGHVGKQAVVVEVIVDRYVMLHLCQVQ